MLAKVPNCDSFGHNDQGYLYWLLCPMSKVTNSESFLTTAYQGWRCWQVQNFASNKHCSNVFIFLHLFAHETASLTPWEPWYDIFILWNWPKTSSCWLPHQRHSSFADCARELFKPSKDSSSLLVCTQRKFFGWGLQIFCEWCHKWSSIWAILAHVIWPRAEPLGQSILLKFSLEIGLNPSLLSLWSTF